MNKKSLMLLAVLGFVLFNSLLATAVLAQSDLEAVTQVQIYNRAIHVMAMLLVGFGFLMVFVRLRTVGPDFHLHDGCHRHPRLLSA